jgi:outer membrane protein
MAWKIQRLLFFFIVIALAVPVFASGNENAMTEPELLSLENCLNIAFQNSQEMKAAAENVIIAREQLYQAEGGLWPTLGYEISASGSDQDQYQWSELLGLESKKVSIAGISLTQPQYSGGKITEGIQLAKLSLENSMEDERKVKQNLTFNVKSAYYQVWLAQQTLKVAESSYDNLGRHARQVETLCKIGKVSQYDLLRAEVEHENLKPALIKAQNGVVLAKLNLATLIGLEKNRLYRVDFDLSELHLPEQVATDLEEMLKEAYQDRPEIREFQKLLVMANLQTDMAYAGYKPTVTLTGSYQGTAFGYDPGSWSDNKAWTLTLDIKGNFFDGLGTPAKIKEKKANERLAVINESKLRDQIYQDVEQSVQELKESLEVIHANEGNKSLAEKSLKMTQDKFDIGIATTIDVRDAQLAMDQALNGYYEGISSYLTALAKLDLAVGKE